MRFEINHKLDANVLSLIRRLDNKLRRIENNVDLLVTQQEYIMATMQELQTAVARNHQTEDSVLQLLEGISQQLKDAQASNDPQAIQRLIADIDASTDKLAQAVVRNTPAQNEPSVEQPQA